MSGVQDILTKSLCNVKENIKRAMEQHGRNASGRSIASLQVVVNGNSGMLFGSKSFLSMERGKSPGKVPYGFRDIIKQWIIDKGISFLPIPAKSKNVKYTPYERGLNSFAGAVAWKIMKEGTKLHRDKGFNDIFTSAVNDELKSLQDKMILITSQSIAEINKDL